MDLPPLLLAERLEFSPGEVPLREPKGLDTIN